MKHRSNQKFQRRGTRFSEDGRSVYVRLRVDRRAYEFAKGWAEFHSPADPTGTAEEQLEGYLGMALVSHMDRLDWTAPPEIEALYPKAQNEECATCYLDDEIPF